MSADVRLRSGGVLLGTVRAASTGQGVDEATVTLVDPAGAVVATTVQVTEDDVTVAEIRLRAQGAGSQQRGEVPAR